MDCLCSFCPSTLFFYLLFSLFPFQNDLEYKNSIKVNALWRPQCRILHVGNADFCILVFDASRRLGMKSVPKWASEVRAHAPTARIFLVGNKIDWGQSACETEEAIALAQELGFVGVAFLSAKHMKRAEILPLIQPLFNVPRDDDDWQQDDLDRPLLGGIELSSPEPFQPSRCCFF